MNSFIETLNQCGGNFLSFAWPMLWQSSLLIVALLAFDFLFRRKLRASIRYALWLVVLVKLCVPPTLALPTSPAWWLQKTPPPIAAKAEPHYTVTYDNGPLPEIPQAPLPVFVPPKLAMMNAAWLLVASAAVSSALLLWLLVRWWQITRQVRRAVISERMAALADEAQKFIGMKFKVQVKLTTNSMSPAVCGLFRPAILIPQSLAENFSDEQLRAVLLHELIHLRRRDVWLNFLQSLLQIFYWWHPLVWLANVRIRQAREEAVDDAVMLVLRDEAETYAPTLLEVAKLALNRPLASLGLVGILESRHALRQRIERLVDFRPPRQAGLTLVSLLGILAFTAVAVPMGEKPAPAEKPAAIGSTAVEEQSLTVKVNPEIFIRNVKAQAGKYLLAPTNDYTDILLDALRSEGVDCNPPHGLAFNTKTGEITTQNTPDKLEVFRQVMEQLNRADGICELPLHNSALRKKLVLIQAGIYEMRDSDFQKLALGLEFYRGSHGNGSWWSVAPEKFNQLLGNMESSGMNPVQRPRIQTSSGMPAQFYVGNETNYFEFDCIPFAKDGFVDLTLQSTVVTGPPAKAAFTNQFNTKASAEDHGGIVVRMENFGGHAGSNLVAIIGVQILTNGAPAHFQQRLQAIIKPAGENGQTNSIATGAGRKAVIAKLEHIRLDKFSSDGLPLHELLGQLAEQSKLRDPEHKGINFLINDNADYSGVQGSVVNPLTGLLSTADNTIAFPGQPPRTSPAAGTGFSADIPITVAAMQDVTLADALDAIVKGAAKPVHIQILDYGVRFQAGTNPPALFTRSYKLDTNALAINLPKNSATNIGLALCSAITNAGVDLSSPSGNAVFYKDTTGKLLVRATQNDLDLIEPVIQKLNYTPPYVHIKARFLEVPNKTLQGFVAPNLFTNAAVQSGTNIWPERLTGLLTDKNFKAVLRALESKPGTMALAEPDVTTMSGRQTQMRATQVITVITNFTFQENGTNGSIISQTENVETGPVLDVVPCVLSDGYTINLALIPSLTEFLGYDKPTNPTTAYNRAGEKIDVPKILPRFSVRQMVTTLNLWDGQTAVIGGLLEKNYVGGKEVADKSKSSDKELLVFITATLVDPAGNRVHTDDDLPFAQKGIPPQPPQPK